MNWTRRNHAGLPWLDFVDAPIGLNSESYIVDIHGDNTPVFRRQTNEPMLVLDEVDLNTIGPRPWQVQIRQLGRYGPSDPLLTSII